MTDIPREAILKLKKLCDSYAYECEMGDGHGFDEIVSFVTSLLSSVRAHDKAVFLKKIEGMRRVCSAEENGESPDGCSCAEYNQAIDNVLFTLRTEIEKEMK
jgi:hypothetical protein